MHSNAPCSEEELNVDQVLRLSIPVAKVKPNIMIVFKDCPLL